MESQDRPTNGIHSLLDEDQIARIVGKQSVLRELEQSKLTKAEFIRSRKIPRSTLYRDLARRKTSGFAGLIDRRKVSRKKGIKLDDRATEVVLDFMVDHPQAPYTAIHSEITNRYRDGNWGTPPAYDRIRRFCQSIASDVLHQWSQGRKARIEDKALTVRRIVTEVNSLWQSDCSELPIWTFDPTIGPDLFKPWIVGTLDAASRVVPGALVCKMPNAADVLSCWKKAMLAKGTPTYPFCGVPSVMSFDNAQIFKGDAWQSLVALTVEPSPIENDSPEQNGKQERWFQTLQKKLISHLEGFADQHRGKDKAKKSCIPYPLLQKLVDDWILEYHLTEHRELGMSPWEYWHRYLADAHGMLVSAAEIDRCLRVSRDVKVSADGLHIDNRRFIGTFMEGRVGDTLTARIPPEGAKDSVAVYDHGLYQGDAVEYISTELAEEISASRLERTIAIDRLAKAIREKNGQAAPVPPPASAVVKEPEKTIVVPDPLAAADSAGADNAGNLGPIPDLPKTGEATA